MSKVNHTNRARGAKFLKSNKDIEKNYQEHISFVTKILNSVIRKYGYVISYSEREDLIQIGLVNLIDSYRKYDKSTGVPFHSYANKRIFGCFIDEFRNNSVIPRRQQAVYKCYQNLVSECASNGENLSLSKAAKYLDLEVDKLSAMILNWEARYSSSFEDVNDLLQAGSDNPHTLIEKSVDRQLLLNAISNLTDREQTVLSLYFDKEMSLQEVSSVIGVSDSRVSQIKNEAIFKIRNQIR